MNKIDESASPTFVEAARQPIEAVEPGIKRQMLGYGPELMMCRVWFEKNAVGQVHSHPHSQSSYVESGRFRITIDGQERELEAGDSFYVAADLGHGAMCLESGSLLDAFSPARADFLTRKG